MKKETKLKVLSTVYDDMYDYYVTKLDELKTLLTDETDTTTIKIIDCYIDIYTALKNDLYYNLLKIKDRLLSQ